MQPVLDYRSFLPHTCMKYTTMKSNNFQIDNDLLKRMQKRFIYFQTDLILGGSTESFSKGQKVPTYEKYSFI